MSGTFAYTARDMEGRFVAGRMIARSSDEVFDVLRARALVVTAVDPTTSPRGMLARAFGVRRRDPRARVALFRSLAALVKAGLPLRRALEVAGADCRDGGMREASMGVAAEIEAGASFSTALSRRTHVFSRVTCAMVRAGEVGGALDEALERVAALAERDRALRLRVQAALAYPAIVSVAAIALVVFLVTGIVPTIVGMLDGVGVALPPMTRALIAVGFALRSPWAWLALLGSAILAMALRSLAWKSPAARRALERSALLVPVWGKLMRTADVASCARTLGALIHSGVALDAALEITADATASLLVRDGFVAVAKRLRVGQSLADAFAVPELFDTLFLALLRAGEESGGLADMLLRLADYADADVDAAIATLTSVLEPVLILGLGIVVGSIVAAVLMPLYSAIGNIR